MKLITYSVSVSKANEGWYVKSQHTGARMAMYLKDELDCFDPTDGRVLGIMTDNVSSNYSMTYELQSTLEASVIKWPALRNHIPCMAHIIQLALGTFISQLAAKCRTKSWVAHEPNQQIGENESIEIGKSQWLREEGNARINKVSAMTSGVAEIIVTVRISRYCESPETDLHIAENACCTDNALTWSSKRVHSLSHCQTLHCGTTYYGCEVMMELNTDVVWVRLSMIWIYPQVAPTSKIHWLPATVHNTVWMDNCQEHHGCFEAIPLLDPVDVKEVSSHTISLQHSLQW